MPKSVSLMAAQLADREAIRECHLQYARAIDRADNMLLSDVFWPDGTVYFENLFDGSVVDYIQNLAPGAASQMEQTAHLMGNNTTIEIAGNKARTESYVMAFHRLPGDGEPFDLFLAGRYLDELEKRNDVWRILHRRFQSDWFRECPDSADWHKGFFGLQMTPGVRFPQDFSYHHFS